jgi:hypothetical protein
VRPKFSWTCCDRVVEAPAPSRPIERGAGPALLAHVIVSKFSDSLPLNRRSEICSRQGVDISRCTLAGWVGGASDLVKAKLQGISKRGNVYPRKILIHGARAAVLRIKRDRARIGAWLYALDANAPKNIVVVAMANKLARIAWTVLSSGQDYRPTAKAIPV